MTIFVRELQRRVRGQPSEVPSFRLGLYGLLAFAVVLFVGYIVIGLLSGWDRSPYDH
ncbi:MAG: hypothetical protein M3P18_14975 [Actinomycetota bacterium]|nr:hypothetical protein [Actinomycetota bacterium]